MEDMENKPPMPPFPPVAKVNEEVDDAAEDWTGDPPESDSDETKSLTDVAKEVFEGKWGEGQERRIALANAGFDPNAVKAEMVRLANDKT